MLQNILSTIASELGIKLTSTEERDYLISRINITAQSLYDENELFGCTRENVFNIGSTDQQITLPWYVDKVIACRDYASRAPIEKNTQHPRYHASSWLAPYLNYPYLKWRMKGDSATIRDIVNAGYLTITLPSANSSLFTVIITGGTANANRTQEVVTFLVGDTSKTTVGLFTSIESIRKSSTTDVDVTVTDIDGNTLAIIPNSELTTLYKLVQVLDRDEIRTQSQLVEVLYKLKYTPFVNDYDKFTAGDVYDNAIVWQTIAEILALRGKAEDMQRASMYHEKAVMVIANVIKSMEGAMDKKIQFGKNKVFDILSDLGQSSVTCGTTYGV